MWRHLDPFQYQTFLHARVPWAEVRSRLTLLMERLIIDLIQQRSTVIGGCRIARLT